MIRLKQSSLGRNALTQARKSVRLPFNPNPVEGGSSPNLARRESVGSISAEEYKALGKQKKPSKFKNKWETVDGIKFRSQREANRYSELKLLQERGKIERLELQPRYPLRVNGELICTYVADFRYVTPGKGMTTEDVKGMRTYVYKIKKKLVKAIYNFDVVEI